MGHTDLVSRIEVLISLTDQNRRSVVILSEQPERTHELSSIDGLIDFDILVSSGVVRFSLFLDPVVLTVIRPIQVQISVHLISLNFRWS